MQKLISVSLLAVLATGGACASARSGSDASQPKSSGELAQQKSATGEVKIDNFSFTPPTLTISVGTTVTWTNRDDIPHTVVSSDDTKLFKSKPLDTDEKFSFTFSKPGTYSYFCSIHPKMTGKVTVQ